MSTERSMRYVAAIAAALLTGLFAGCVTTSDSRGQQHVEFPTQLPGAFDGDTARIYVARPAMTGESEEIPVYDGDTRIGLTVGGSYLCWLRPPGDVAVRAEMRGPNEVAFVALAGYSYYLFLDVQPTTYSRTRRLVMVKPPWGEMYLNWCRAPIVGSDAISFLKGTDHE